MVDQNTAKYLNDNIGAVLSRALSEMAVQQPNDGVDFLSQWLATYAEQEELKMIRQKEEIQMQEDRAFIQRQEGEKAARRDQKVSDTKAIDDGYKSLLDKLTNPEQLFQDSYWSELVDVAKQYMGAQSVYLGILDEEGLEDTEPPIIRYTHQSIFADSPSLLEKTLPKMKDAETATLTYGALTESVPEEEHKAKCLWKPPLPPQPPVPEGEEPPPPPEGPKYLPVSVPCVTDVSTMHYFEMPRLGAYLACPLVYPTYYTQEAFGEAKKFEEEQAADVKAKADKVAEREAQIAEAEEKGLEAPTFEDEEAQPEKVMALTGTTTKSVLCMDTLGTNTLFDESKLAPLMALCDALAACKARSEIKEIDNQALFSIGVERRAAAEDAETGLPKLREDANTALQEQQAEAMKEIADKGLDPDPRKVVEEVCAKKFAHLQARAVVEYYKEHIKIWAKTCVTVQPDVLNIIAAIAFLVGYIKADVYLPKKTMLKWSKMKNLMADETQADAFFGKIEGSNLDIGGRKGLVAEQKLNFIQSLCPPEYNEEKAREIDPAFEVLWTFLSTAIDYRTSALKQAQADYDERKKKAEEEEQAFEEPDLATVDDDFDGLAAA